MSPRKKTLPKQSQERPGLENEMNPRPIAHDTEYKGSGKLKDKVAVITGGDSGIGRAVAIAFAKEGADSCIIYLSEHTDARETQRLVEKEGRRCIAISGDVGDEQVCRNAIIKTYATFGHIDVLVNNAAERHVEDDIKKISGKQLERIFRTNMFSYFYCAKAALAYMKEGGSIINTTSDAAYRGSDHLIDYSATKGAIVAFTRSLALNLAKKDIRVNGVAPGPVWTPMIPSSFSEEQVAEFGMDVPMGRAAQPEEIAYCYVFLASGDASYMTGQILHPNGGQIVNG